MLGIDLGQLSADDAHYDYDGKSKGLLMPWVLLDKSDINNGKSRASAAWCFYLLCCVATIILSVIVAYFWKTSLLITAIFGISFSTRGIVRLIKKAR